jgi:hypothetical protein
VPGGSASLRAVRGTNRREATFPMRHSFRHRLFTRFSLLVLALCWHSASGAQVPGAPVISGAVAGDAQGFIAFNAPGAAGSSPITTYTATCNPGPIGGSGSTSPIRVQPLANSTAYTCTVSATNASGSGPASAAASVTPLAGAPLSLIGTVSRKSHAASGNFDIAIVPAAIDGAVSVEPRAIGGGHQIVFQFNAAINSTGSVSVIDDAMASVSATTATSGNEVVVTIPAVANGKRVTVTLPSANGIAVNATASLAFMLGDGNNSRSTDSADVSGAKLYAGGFTTAANFRFDINTSGSVNAADIAAIKSRSSTPVAPAGNPIMFVTQVPTLNDFASRASTFGNHTSSMDNVARGGDLMIRYPDGTLRNLTQEAGFGMSGFQGANAIAVREPTVHWSGTKAVFSMVVGAPMQQYQVATYYWQLYEVSGLGKGQTAIITKVPMQPATYNNISPLYGTDDRILFTSDRPRDGQAHLYPQRDEYESTATVTGIWSLDPVTGDLRLLNHTPSGAFSPSIDSFGRVIFTRWDHLQQDQQADADRTSPGAPSYGSFNYASEAPGAAALNSRAEVYPETRANSVSATFGNVNGYTSNFFTPWQMNEDGSDEETLNHVGRHELSFGYIPPSFADDPALSYYTNDSIHANTKSVRMDGGLFHLREDPLHPGTYFGIAAREFGSLTSNQIVKLTGGPSVNAEAMVLSDVTAPDIVVNNALSSPGGRFRNPLPTTMNSLIASHTPANAPSAALMKEFRLKPLTVDAASGLYLPGAPLTGAGISKSVTWWSPDVASSYSGLLWELEAVEVVARPRPSRPATPLEAPESAVFSEEGVSETALRNWLRANDLALIVTRNQTSRDRADLQQPFNLRVPGGLTTVKAGGGKVYDITHFQIFQGDLIRGYTGPGRRVIAQPLHAPNTSLALDPAGPPSSVKIAADGSTAAFVPARRALAWQSTDATGNPVVRERVWVTMQPGEVRVCASCHGANTQNQAAQPSPTNKPEALRTLLRAWKLLPP